MPQQDSLRELTSLCQQLRNAEAELEDLDQKWKDKKEEVRRISEDDIPSLMTELGVSKIALESGEVITVKGEVEASLPKEDVEKREAAFAWLEKNEHDGIIKTVVGLQFGRGELAQAKEVAKKLGDETGKPVALERTVHANTLKAFVKERLAAGEAIPMDLFQARAFQKAKVK